jgi:acyl-CoA synthetase (AMP-forming)/AMP-acid ligase II
MQINQLNYKSESKPDSLVELLQEKALERANERLYTFLTDGETQEIYLTYAQLDAKAKLIAVWLQSMDLEGERALLLYPPGLDFIAAFMGCLYAGVIAVPAYPPRANQSLERLEVIILDAQAKVALTTEALLPNIERGFANNLELADMRCLATDNLSEELLSSWQKPSIDRNSLAFLQYTSGSTGNPKGVMVSHGNLLANLQTIHQCFGHTAQSQGVIWLPLYHDMGLIGGVLQPLYGGFPVTLMSPMHFLQKPMRWLQAVSRYKATTSGGPNFAYDVVCRKVTAEQLATLDLSNWEVAFSGAEPIRAETIELFVKTFEPCGFRREALYPCYGMAENTLIVTGGYKEKPPVFLSIQEAELEQNQVIEADPEEKGVRTFVACGHAWLEQQVKIVDPDSLTECGDERVGEIWVSGSSVAGGYWNQPDLSETTFSAYLSDTGEGPFLRTGDLGFIKDRQLFVTGRLKDVIIIRGRNHYPQDIERTIEHCHSALAPNRSAAFAVEVNGEEKLVIVAEVERRFRERRRQSFDELSDDSERRQPVSGGRRDEPHIDPGFEVVLPEPPNLDSAIDSIRAAVSKHHGLQVYAVLLLRIGSIPKTSSGKIRRHACRNGFLDGSLNIVGGDRHLLGSTNDG